MYNMQFTKQLGF